MNKNFLIFGGSGDLGQALIGYIQSIYDGKIWASYHSNFFSKCDVDVFYFDAEKGLDELKIRLFEREKIDVLIYLIGTHSSKNKIKDTELNEWRNVLEVNAFGFLKVYNQLYLSLVRSKTKILVISSSAASENKKLNGPYSASKVFLESICMTIAKEEKDLHIIILEISLFDSKLARMTVKLKGYDDFEEYVRVELNGCILSRKDILYTIKNILEDKTDQYKSGDVVKLIR